MRNPVVIWTVAALAAVCVGLALLACAPGAPPGATTPPESQPASSPLAGLPSSPGPAVTPAAVERTVRIYLIDPAVDKLDLRPEDLAAVTRTVAVRDGQIGAAALEALAAGPIAAEQAQGYYSQVQRILRGPSTCGGPSFGLTIDTAGVATARLCRQTLSAGMGDDARFLAQVRATLQQFPTVRQVRTLTHDGHCFGDMSGLNRC